MIAEKRNILLKKIKNVDSMSFEETALAVFQYQATFNPLYASYLSLLNISINKINNISEIPFLPISLFKSKTIQTGKWESQVIFTSSGTTTDTKSQHLARDVDHYLYNTICGFTQFYPHPKKLCVLGLLPSYLEREGSSLVSMVHHFIQLSGVPKSDFFLYNFEQLAEVLQYCNKKNIPCLLIGVSFALLDFAAQFNMPLKNTIVMETGGMKGRKKEMIRDELHLILKNAFQIEQVHSEYGMTELFSQAYALKNGMFSPAATLLATTREINDPFATQKFGKPGLLNFVDLANLDTCSFVATDDLGIVYKNGNFEVLGRVDNSDRRGCNLLAISNLT